MMFVVLFEDDPSRSTMRERLMTAHLAFLKENAAFIQTAGPLKDASTQAAAGGLWLVEAESAEQVRALCEKDPLWPSGLRKFVRIFEWRRVFLDGKPLTGKGR